jgi:hypothetical protein
MSTTPNRAIDRHEDAICDVLLLCATLLELGGWEAPYASVVDCIAREYNLTPERLDQLVRCWCAVAGIAVPA